VDGGGGGKELPAAPQQLGVVVGRLVVLVDADGPGPVPGLDPHERLEAAQCGRRLPPHRLPADQRLQPHQALERPQRPPSLRFPAESPGSVSQRHECCRKGWRNGAIRIHFTNKQRINLFVKTRTKKICIFG